MTPEEVDKIRRLAEGLLYMGEVQQQGGTLRRDLQALCVFIRRGKDSHLGISTLTRLERGLRAYVGRMIAQLSAGQKEYETFKSDLKQGPTQGLLARCEEAYDGLFKDLNQTLSRLHDHEAILRQQTGDSKGAALSSKSDKKKKKKKGVVKAVTHGTQNVLMQVEASIQVRSNTQRAMRIYWHFTVTCAHSLYSQ